jgi:nitrous oxide reductase accessory protein NosL
VACIDSNGDGLLDISTAVSWDNQKNNTCQNVGDAIPNTPSKCRYGTVDITNVTVIVPPGEIQVQKTAEPTQLAEPGGTVEFTYVVENPSSITVTLESLVDSVYGPLEQADGDCTVPQTLGPAGTYMCSINAQVLGSPGVYENTVTASGTDWNQDPVSDTDTASVTIVSAPPGDIQVQKTAEPTQLTVPGGAVEFTYAVENPSSITVTLESLVDSVYGPLEQADGDCAVPQTLGPAGTYVCSISAQVLGSPGIYENAVTASGVDWNQDPITDTDTASVTIVSAPPGDIQVQKTAEPTQLTEPGGTVEFTYVVENPSSITVTLESLVDSVYGPLEQADGDCVVPQTLGPASTYVCSISAQVLGSPGIYENAVTASGVDWNQDPITDTDTASVMIVMEPPDTGIGLATATIVGAIAAGGLALLAAGAAIRRKMVP